MMAEGRNEARSRSDRGARPGPVQALAVPQRTGAFRWIVMVLMTVSTLALVAIAGLTALVYQQLKASDVAALKQDITGVKTETASFHADVTKSLTALEKSLDKTASEVNSATLQLNDIALGLHKQP